MGAYDAQWRRLRRLTRWSVASLLLGMVLFLLAALVSGRSGPRALLSVLAYGGVACWLAAMVAASAAFLFRCPRCGQRFSQGGTLSFPYARRRCLSCGLELFRDS
jgi:F0F1-type ATP synthase assembly protein I